MQQKVNPVKIYQ